jgi:site-specific recombinase XerC
MRQKPLSASGEAYVAARLATGSIVWVTARDQLSILRRMAQLLGDPPTHQLDRAALDIWLADTRRLAPGTRRTAFSIVRCFCDWLVEEGALARSPFAGVRAPRVPRSVHRALSADDAESLVAICHDSRDRVIAALGFQLGLRRAEIAGLEVGDVSLSRGTVEVRKGKGGNERLVPLTAEAREAILEYLRDAPACAGPLVRGDRYPTKGVAPAWVGRRVTELAYQAGIKERPRDGVSTHALRHTCASDVYEASRDVLAVRDLLGHVSLATTQVYVRGLGVEHLRAVIEGRRYRAPARADSTRIASAGA